MAGSPMYLEIVQWAKGQIFDAAFPPGEKFPSESALCTRFGVSRQTVRHALDILTHEGHIRRVRGSGTYVSGEMAAPPRLARKETPSKTIGVITVNTEYYIFPRIICGIKEILSRRGYRIEVYSTQDDVAQETRALQQMLAMSPAGLIIEPTKSGLPCLNQRLYRSIFQHGIPVVFTDSRYWDIPGPCVALDDEAVGYAATRHLIEMGHRRIAGVFSHTNRSGLLRYRGYARALLEAELPLHDDRLHWYRHETLDDMLRGGLLWATVSTCTAIVCYNDQIALRLMDQLDKHGLRVPEDISIIASDNSDRAQQIGLTSIPHPTEDLGRAAANVLLLMIDGAQGEDVLFKPESITGNSVRNLKFQSETE